MSQLLRGDEHILKHPDYHELGWMKERGRFVPFNKNLGIAPYFSHLVTTRINQQKPCNIVFTGEPGISKTYSALAFARFLQPDFSIDQVVMTHAEYMQCMINLNEGQVIVFDEPEYAMGHRQWYKEANNALVSTMRSGRFKVHPVFMPLINKKLLDKVVRDNLLQYMVMMQDRGEGIVYKFDASQFDEVVYTKFLCRLKIELLDIDKCQKKWCYSCSSFKDKSCQLLRSQYEHKREDIQNQRYRQDLDVTQKEEGRKVPFEEWLRIAYEQYDNLFIVNERGHRKISIERITLLLGCSATMAQRLRQAIKTMTRDEILALVQKRLGLI